MCTMSGKTGISLPSAWRYTIRKKMRLAMKMEINKETEEEEETKLGEDIVIKQEPVEEIKRDDDVQEVFSENFSLIKEEMSEEDPKPVEPPVKRLTEEELLPYGCASCDYR